MLQGQCGHANIRLAGLDDGGCLFVVVQSSAFTVLLHRFCSQPSSHHYEAADGSLCVSPLYCHHCHFTDLFLQEMLKKFGTY